MSKEPGALQIQIKEQIPWADMTPTISTSTFRRIKEYILSLKEDREGIGLVVSPSVLRDRLEATDKSWQFSDDEMITAVRHLEKHGYVTLLREAHGDYSILLTPDVLVNLASSVVLEARRNPRGLGVLEERRLLDGGYAFQELADQEANEKDILLGAATSLFLKHNICFRETFGQQTLLVFPSLINEKRPTDGSIETIEDVTYRIRGAVENVYASLVVLLGYTNTFVRTNQWQNQAQYAVSEREICGFQQTDYHEGEIELVLQYGLIRARNTRTYALAFPGSV